MISPTGGDILEYFIPKLRPTSEGISHKERSHLRAVDILKMPRTMTPPCSRTTMVLLMLLITWQHMERVSSVGHHRGMHQSMENFNPDEEPDEDDANELNKPGFVQDAEHIKEHLDNIDFDPETATPEQVEFYFFKIHDTDGDQTLDGLELLSALRHTVSKHMDRQIEQKTTEEGIKKVVESYQKHLVKRIDRILKDEDKDGDGKLDYVEFAASRKARNALKQVGKHTNPHLDPNA